MWGTWEVIPPLQAMLEPLDGVQRTGVGPPVAPERARLGAPKRPSHAATRGLGVPTTKARRPHAVGQPHANLIVTTASSNLYRDHHALLLFRLYRRTHSRRSHFSSPPTHLQWPLSSPPPRC